MSFDRFHSSIMPAASRRSCFLLLLVILQYSPALIAAEWKTLAPIPDSVGFAGMFAGPSGKSLVAGGGSQFPEKPVWHGGKKTFGDRFYALDHPDGKWRILGDRLPVPISHAAAASSHDRLYVVGGLNADGLLRSAYAFSLDGFSVRQIKLPDFPIPLAYGAAAVVKNALFVVGGASTPELNDHNASCWKLRLDQVGLPGGTWEKVATFPGEATFAPGAAADRDFLYVFGGARYIKDASGKSKPVPSKQNYRFDSITNIWEKLADMPSARMAPASPAAVTVQGDILVAGGYASVFGGELKEHPGFESESYLYTPLSNVWRPGPKLPCERHIDESRTTSPGPEPMIAAPATVWRGRLVIIGGEVRPATRTTAVIQLPLDSF